jgi:hypothetical protein
VDNHDDRVLDQTEDSVCHDGKPHHLRTGLCSGKKRHLLFDHVSVETAAQGRHAKQTGFLHGQNFGVRERTFERKSGNQFQSDQKQYRHSWVCTVLFWRNDPAFDDFLNQHDRVRFGSGGEDRTDNADGDPLPIRYAVLPPDATIQRPLDLGIRVVVADE